MPEIDRTDKIEHNIALTKEEIVKAIAAAGIVGMGGATFPTQVKLTPPPGNKAEILIINGVECEPYLTADHRVMLEKAEEIIIGVQVLMKATDVKRLLSASKTTKKMQSPICGNSSQSTGNRNLPAASQISAGRGKNN